MLSVFASGRHRPAPGGTELIAMVGALMGLNALAIDIMLPALSEIGAALDRPGNAPQLVVTVYVFGFGLAQLVYGPLADALGRRTVLLWALAAFVAASVACLFATDFTWLLIARGLQGVAAAATRVVAVAAVRDLVSGRRMAQVMSFAMMVFMAAPIFAPALGQLILFAGDWRWIFAALMAGGAILGIWMHMRLPETLAEENRIPLNFGAAGRNYWLAAKNRVSLGYMIASAFIFGALFAFIATSEQVIAQLYGLEHWFALAFAGVAVGLALANVINARIVGRLGMRRVSHGALIAFLVISLAHTLISLAGLPPFWLFYILLGSAMMMFALMGANFSALMMEPAGERAGTAAALYGSVTSVSGAVLGSVIGQAYDGSVTPILAGMALLGVGALAAVWITEKGRLLGAGEVEAEAAEPR
ncbi:MAG: multidrug effflux MFS transporter [Pseudomonadota bacterium]